MRGEAGKRSKQQAHDESRCRGCVVKLMLKITQADRVRVTARRQEEARADQSPWLVSLVGAN